MFSVSSEAAIRASQAAVRGRLSDGSDAPQTSGFSELVDSTVSARDIASDRSVTDRPAPARDDGPAANLGKEAANPKQRDSRADGTDTDSANQDNTAATDAQPAIDGTATASTKPGTANATAIAIAAIAIATGGDSPADPTAPKADEQTDTTTSDSTTAAAPTLPTLIIAAIAPAPSTSTPPAATNPEGQNAIAAPGAIAAAAAVKVAAEISAPQPTVLPAATDASAAAPAESATDQVATDLGPAVTIQVTADPAAEAQATGSPGAAADQSSPNATNAAAPAALLTEATAVIAEASQPQTIVAGKDRQPTDTPSVPKTGFIDSGKIDAASAVTTPVAADGDSKPGLDAAASVPNKPAEIAEQAPEKLRESAAKDDGAIDAKPAPAAHHNPAAEPKLAAPATQAALDTAATQTTTLAAPLSTSVVATPVDTSNLVVANGATVSLNSLAVEISSHARAGNTRFEIRLDPPELGRIDVRLDVDRSGHVTSRLFVEKSETLDLLKRDAPQLQQALQDAGLKTGDNGLQFSLRDQNPQGRGDGNGSNQNAQRVVIAEEDTVTVEAAGRFYGRASGASGGIDIRV